MMRDRGIIVKTIVLASLLLTFILLIVSFPKPDEFSSDAGTQPLGDMNAMPIATVSIVPPITSTVLSIRTVIPAITSTVMYQGTPIEVVDRRYILAGKSPEEVAGYVVRKVAPSLLGPHGPIQVRLARPITREEMPQLGLGCLPNTSGIEEPPYMLVILEGDFDLSGIPRTDQLPPGTRFRFSALIIDVWAAGATSIRSSADGALFRQILNDPSLPEMTPGPPRSCPTYVPGDYPHGAVVYGTVFPTSPPAPTRTIEVAPPPVPTQNP